MSRKSVGWILGIAVVAACARQSPQADSVPVDASSPECVPVVGTLQSGTTAAAISGQFSLQLVATSGRFSDRRVKGTMDITSTQPRRGTAIIDLDTIGAVAPGPASPDRSYAVEVVEWSTMTQGVSTPRITLRLGTQPPAPTGTRQIEGEYMALHVNAIGGDGFTGRWESGSGSSLATAAGHFCAKSR